MTASGVQLQSREDVERFQQAQKKSKRRMKRLRGSPHQVLRQAALSYRDFFTYYGDPLGDWKKVQQADYTTSTTGLLNRIFGQNIWPQLNIQAPTWNVLPKSQRRRSSPLGWRAKTAFASTGKGGQSEGNIPTAITGTYAEVSPSPKEHSTQSRVSGLHQDMGDIDDTILSSLQELQQDVVIEHTKQIERALTEDVDTTAGNNVESVDRVSADSANQSTIGWDAGDEDIFGVDRSANTWANAQQDAASTARTLTTSLVDGIFRQVVAEQADPTFWLTGYDTWESIASLYEDRGRFNMDVDMIDNGTQEDAEVAEGLALSTFVGNLHGRPMITTDQAPADSNELSRLYIFDVSNPEGHDKPRMGIDLIRPTQVFLAGEKSTESPQAIDFLGDSVLVTTRAELGCRAFHKQGQLRDTTSP